MLGSFALLVLDVDADVVFIDVVVDVLKGSHGFQMNCGLRLWGVDVHLGGVGGLLDEVYLLILLYVFVRVHG